MSIYRLKGDAIVDATGYLLCDPDYIPYLKFEKVPMARFNLAVQRPDGAPPIIQTRMNVIVWGRVADWCMCYLRTGSRVRVVSQMFGERPYRQKRICEHCQNESVIYRKSYEFNAHTVELTYGYFDKNIPSPGERRDGRDWTSKKEITTTRVVERAERQAAITASSEETPDLSEIV